MEFYAKKVVSGLYKIEDGCGISFAFYDEPSAFVQIVFDTQQYTAHTVEDALKIVKKVVDDRVSV